MDRWLDDVCRQYKFHKQEMLWLTVDEVLKIIYEKENSFLLAAKKYAELGGRWGIMNPIGYNDIPQKLWLDVVKANKTKGGIKEFSGTIGNGGCVRGRAHIIFDAKNNNKFFNEGEILVTSMTRPEFLPLMSKALAFVTNEGGLTCHAAIVTREMNKPCVIGTKIATQVLKDGNLVEVDGDNGVVRILKK
ncbi:MAG: hypothetical protein JW816_02810 [Candidatus Buchananbacteria bacterium]|nr:hypothetical protein [Candidatus Buchananbacteria bacterium]